MYETETDHTENRLVTAKGEGDGRGRTGSLGLADASCIQNGLNNNVLLYRTWNYIQYPVINHNGSVFFSKKKNIYICTYV